MKSTTLAILAASAMSFNLIASDKDADNTGQNTRDASGTTMTPIDQSNDPADIKITADTRKMLVADDTLSMAAKNVKIITVKGDVTLRGPVDSAKEKTSIVKHAKMCGAKSVTDQLEVTAPDPAHKQP